ncbi:MAG: beta strand repeat-containing protein [Planctomycetota bacterium]|jgi:Ca2+-binding RTX toxin-like protein
MFLTPWLRSIRSNTRRARRNLRPQAAQTSRFAAARTERLEDRSLLTLVLNVAIGNATTLRENPAAVADDDVTISQVGDRLSIFVGSAGFDATSTPASVNNLLYFNAAGDFRVFGTSGPLVSPQNAVRAEILDVDRGGVVDVPSRGLGNLTVELGDGNDQLLFSSQDLHLGTIVSIDGGNGDDDLNVGGQGLNLTPQPGLQNLTVLDVENVSQTGPGGVLVSGDTDIRAIAAGSLNLTAGDNDFQGTLSIDMESSPVSVRDINDLTLGRTRAIALNAISDDAGDITQAPFTNIEVLFSATFNATTGNVFLTNQGGVLTDNLIPNLSFTGNDVAIVESSGNPIGITASSATGDVNLVASGFSIDGTVNLTDGDLTLDVASSSTGIGDVIETVLGELRVTGAGASTNIVLGDLAVAPTSTVLLDRANDLHGPGGTLAINNAFNVTLTDDTDLDLSTPIVTGTLTVDTAGALSQSTPIGVSGTTTITAAGDIDLSDPTNDFSVMMILDGVNTVVRDATSLTTNGVAVQGMLDLLAVGQLNLNATVSAGQSVVLTTQETAFGTNDNINLATAVAVTSTGGNVTFNVADTLQLGRTNTISASSGTGFIAIQLDNPADPRPDLGGGTAILEGTLEASDLTVTGGDDGDLVDASALSVIGVTVMGGAGDDTVIGTETDDDINGEAGADSLTGGPGNDTLVGEAGNDTFAAGAGTDMVDAGDDDDQVNVTFAGGDTTVTGGAGADRISVVDSGIGLPGSVSVDTAGTEADSIIVSPLRNGTVFVDGDAPTMDPGDLLLLSLTDPAIGDPTFYDAMDGTGTSDMFTPFLPQGSVTFSNAAYGIIAYQNIESAFANAETDPVFNADGAFVMGMPPTPMTSSVDDGTPDAFTVTQNAGLITVSIDSGFLAMLPQQGLNSITIVGSTDDDQLTVNENGVDINFEADGRPAPGTPNGDTDAINVLGTGATAVTYRPTGSDLSAGAFEFIDGTAVTVSAVEELQADSFTTVTLTPTASQNHVGIRSGVAIDTVTPVTDLVMAATEADLRADLAGNTGVSLHVLDTPALNLNLGFSDGIGPDDSVIIANDALRTEPTLADVQISTGAGTDLIEIQDSNLQIAAGGTLAIDGGAATDTFRLIAQDDADEFDVNIELRAIGTTDAELTTDGPAGQTTITLANFAGEIAELTGNSSDNEFDLRGWDQLAVALVDGAGGSDSLTALNDPAQTNVWNITGTDEGDVGGFGFIRVENLRGGEDADDRFIFGPTSAVTGLLEAGGINSGLSGGDDTLDFTAYTTPQVFRILQGDARGFQGTTDAVSGNFTGVDTILGGASTLDELIGRDRDTVWEIDGSNRLIDVTVVPQRSLAFSGIEVLTGGAANDEFRVTGSRANRISGGDGDDSLVLTNGASALIGGFTGGAGDDLLDYSGFATNRTITLTDVDSTGFTGTESAISEGFTGVNAVFGGRGTDDTLNGLDRVTTWTILGPSAGIYSDADTAQTLTFGDVTNSLRGVENLNGGSNFDTFLFDQGGTLGGDIDGGGDADTIIGDDTRARMDFFVDGPNTGLLFEAATPVIGGRFVSVETLTGGAGADTFHFSNAGQLDGPIDGVGGIDRLIGDNDGNDFVVTSKDTGTIAGKANVLGVSPNDFANVETLQGGAGPDTFLIDAILVGDVVGQGGDDVVTFTASGITLGSVIGGVGNDTLIGDDNGNIFDVTGDLSGPSPIAAIGTGQLATKTSLFTGIENLVGGAGDDQFNFTALGGVGGFIDGGDEVSGDVISGDEDGNIFTVNALNSGMVSEKVNLFIDIEHLNGGDNADAFNINARIDGNLRGFVGRDTFLIGAGGEVGGDIIGDESNDTIDVRGLVEGDISAGLENDSIILRDGAVIVGVVNGDSGNDTVTINGVVTLSNTLLGDAGNDRFVFENGGEVQFDPPGSVTDAIDGGAGNDTVEGDDDGNVFVVTGADQGTLDGNLPAGTQFVNVQNLVGGDGQDSFTVSGPGDLAGNIQGGASNDTFTVEDGGLVGGTISGEAGDDLLTADFDGNYSRTLTFDGGADNDDIQLTGGGVGATGTYNVGATSDSGQLLTMLTGTQTINFTGLEPIEDLQALDLLTINASAGSDTINVVDAPTAGQTEVNFGGAFELIRFQDNVAVIINAGAGADTVNFDNPNPATGLTTLTINGDAGNDTVNALSNSAAITVNVNGNADDDAVVFSNGVSVSGAVDGGTGSDTLNAQAFTSAIEVTLTNNTADGYDGQAAALVGGGFVGIDSVRGGSSIDTINGQNEGTTWELGPNQLTGSAGTLGFSQFELLNGGTGNDEFEVSGNPAATVTGGDGDDAVRFANNAVLTGSFDGGTGTNTFTLNGFGVTAGYSSDQTVTLTTNSANGFSGTTAAVTGGFAGVDSVEGGAGSDTLVGLDRSSIWSLDGTDQYVDDTTGRTLDFSLFENLQGGSASDTFDMAVMQTQNLFGGSGDDEFLFADGALPDDSLTVDGGDDSDIADFTAHTTANRFNVGGFINIEQINGHGVMPLDHTLAGGAGNDAFIVGGPDRGTLNGVIFENFPNLAGAGGDDSFEILGTGSLTGGVDGETGLDSLNVSGLMPPLTVTVDSTGTDDGFDGTVSLNLTGYANINDLIGTGSSILTSMLVTGGDVVWSLDVTESITAGANSMTFAGFTTLNGSGDDDDFDVLTSLTRTITGGGGADSVNLASGVTLTGDVSGDAGDDVIALGTGASIDGSVDGGADNDRLDYSTSATGVTVDLAGIGATDGYTGTATGITGTFTNIDGLAGSTGTDTLNGRDEMATWDLGDTTPGVNTYDDATGPVFQFSAVENLNGGSDVDTFNLGDAQTLNLSGDAGDDAFNFTTNVSRLTGSVSGGADNDSLSFAGFTTTTADATLTGNTTDGFAGTASSVLTGGFSGIFALTGGAATDTLTGQDSPATWLVELTNTYRDDLTGRTLAFVDYDNLTGGSELDTFTIQNTLNGNISGQGGGDVVEVQVGTITTGVVNGDISTGDGDDLVSFEDETAVTGSVSTGAGNDLVVFNYDGTTSRTFGSVDVGTGTDEIRFNGNDASADVVYDVGPAADQGTLTTTIGLNTQTVNFSGITPGAGETVNDRQMGATVTVNGTSAADTINVVDGQVIPPFEFTFFTEVNFNGAFPELQVQNKPRLVIASGNNADTITVDNPNTATGLTTTNVLAGDGADTIQINRDHAGDLSGESGNDTFVFADGVSITGESAAPVQGGSGIDTFDLSQLSSGLNVLLSSSAIEGYTGTEASVLNAGGQFTGIDAILGTAQNDTLNGLNVDSIWELDGTDRYIDVSSFPGRILSFSSFDSLAGGTGNDRFELSDSREVDLLGGDGDDTAAFLTDTAAITGVGTFVGGTGTNTLEFTGVSSAVAVTVDGSTPDGFAGMVAQIAGSFFDVSDFVGGSSGSDTFTGLNNIGTWNVDGMTGVTNYAAGSAAGDLTQFETLIGGNSIDSFNIDGAATLNLTGGDDDDLFVFANGATLNGLIDGGSESIEDVVDFSASVTAVTINISDYVDIERFVGTSLGDSLLGTDGSDTFIIDGVDSGTVNGVAFSDVGNLDGGSGADSFVFDNDTAALTGTVAGGSDNDTLSASGVTTGVAFTLAGPGTIDGFDGNAGGLLSGFSDINTLMGGSGSDSLTGLDTESTWSISSVSSYTSGSVTLAATGIEDYIGQSMVDTFNVVGSVAANISTGDGDDTVNLAGAAALTGNVLTGADNDTVLFSTGASITGMVDTGADADTLDFSTSVTPIDVTLTAANAGNGFDGTLASINGGFSGVEMIAAGSGDDSLTGLDTVSTWTVGATQSYLDTVSGETLVISGFDNLSGGSDADAFDLTASASVDLSGGDGTDSFAFAGGVVISGSVAGDAGDDTFTFFGSVTLPTLMDGGADIDTVDMSGGLTPVNVNLDTFLNMEFVTGTTGSDTLTGSSGNDSFAVAGASNSGTVGSLTFQSFENAAGGDGDDIFDLANGLGLSGSIDGGAGSDTVDYGDYSTAVSVDMAAGTATNIAGGISAIENATGGSAGDALTGDSGNNQLTGGDGNDTLTDGFGDDLLIGGDGSDRYVMTPGSADVIDETGGGMFDEDVIDFSLSTGPITIDLDSNSVQSVLDSHTVQILGTVESFVGSVGDDHVTATGNGFVVARNINGFGGSDTLAATDLGLTWNITGADAGSFLAVFFTSIENLTGEAGDDLFDFADGGTISGTIDGGAGNDSFDFNDYTSGASVDVDRLVSIENLTGSPQTDTITGSASGSTFNVTGADLGTVDGVAFASFENYTGRAGDDSFIFGASGSTSGTVNGGDGTNTLTLSSNDDSVVLSGAGLTVGFAGMFSGNAFTNINALDTGAGDDSLTGLDEVSTWTLDTTNSYAALSRSMTFANVETANGGSSADTFNISGSHTIGLFSGDGSDVFNFADGATLDGVIDAGSGSDQVVYAGATPQAIVLSGANVMNGGYDASNGDTDFLSLDAVLGGSGNDTLQGTNGDSVWSLMTGGSSYTDNGGTNTFSFNAIEDLTGGSGVDTFEVTGTQSIGLNGGDGDDTVAFQTDGSDLTRPIQGGAGVDTLDYSLLTQSVEVELASLNSFESLIGGSGVDSILGDATDNVFAMNGANSGTADGIAFQDFEIVDGADGSDTYDLSGFGTARDVVLTGVGTSGVTGQESLTGGFANIDVITGSNSDALTGADLASTWSLGATNTYTAGGQSVTFTGVSELLGGSDTDNFNLSTSQTLDIDGGDGDDSLVLGNGTSLTGTFAGNTGTDTIDQSAFTTAIVATVNGAGVPDGLNFSTAAVTAQSSEALLTGSGVDELVGMNAASTWSLGATDQYTTSGRTISVTGVETRTAGSGTDTISVQVDALVAGADHTVSGNGGSDAISLNFAAAATLDGTATLTIDGGDPAATLTDSDNVSINTAQAGDGARSVGLAWGTGVSVTGLGGTIQIDATETLSVTGDSADDDSVTVTGTAVDDTIIVAPAADGANLFLGGTVAMPGVAAGGNGPDISLSGVSSTGLTIDGSTLNADELVYDGNGMVIADGATSGTIAGSGVIDVNYVNIENLSSPNPFGFTLDAQGDADDTLRDDFVVSRNGDLIEITANMNLLLSEDAADIASLTINGSGDDDSLLVDLTNGEAIPTGGITFNGAGQTSVDGDELTVNGSGTESAIYTPDAATDGDGVVTIDGSAITFTGLEPVTLDNMVDLTFVSPNAGDDITVNSAAGETTISGSSGGVGFESISFTNIGIVSIDAATNGNDGSADSVVFTSDLSGTGITSLSVSTGDGDDSIDAGALTSVGVNVDAGDGDDSITGSQTDDTLAGGAGVDRITDSATGTLTLTDTLISAGDTDVLDSIDFAELSGSSEADTFDATGFSGDTAVELFGGNDVFLGGSGDDFVVGNGGNDSLVGNDGNDLLLGGMELDTIVGGAGNDTVRGQGGRDDLSGGEGDDRIDGGDSADLVREVGPGGFTVTDTTMTGLGNDTLIGLERVVLTTGDGDDQVDLTAFNGNTSLVYLMAGDDTFLGSPGADKVIGFAGRDQLFGFEGNDTLRGAGGRDVVDGGDGNDFLYGQGSVDQLTGGLGDDLLHAGAGNDFLIESGDVDFVLTNVSLTGLGTDTLIGFENVSLTGGDSANVIDASASSSKNTINSGGGDDVVTGGSNIDVIDAGAGNDVVSGGAGDDTINGGEGNDILDGGVGNGDQVVVTADNDLTLTDSQTTGAGTDSITNFEEGRLNGGESANRLDASGSSLMTFLSGLGGDDSLAGGEGTTVLDGGSGFDRTELVGTNVILSDVGLGTGLSLISVEGVALVAGSTDSLLDASAYTGGPVTLVGGPGNDTLLGGSGDDNLNGFGGNDSLSGGEGNDVLTGGAGNDSADGGAGNDTLRGNSGADDLRGGEGNDLIHGDADADLLFGGSGLDVIYGGDGADGINGGSGDDLLVGESGNDTLLGLDGDDVAIGGASNDQILGGAGNDTLRGNGGVDRIGGGSGTNVIDASAREIDNLFSEADFPLLME